MFGEPGTFNGSDELCRDVVPGLRGDFLEAGRTGDVDFGEAVADHVEPGEENAVFPGPRGDGLGDLAVARTQGLRARGAAGREVAARLAGQGDARQRPRHHLAVDQEYPFVAVLDGGQVALRHDRASAAPG